MANYYSNQPHVRAYKRYFKIPDDEERLSEWVDDDKSASEQVMSHIHHIKFRSHGGTDDIDNLIGLTVDQHDRAHLKKKPYIRAEDLLKIVRRRKLINIL